MGIEAAYSLLSRVLAPLTLSVTLSGPWGRNKAPAGPGECGGIQGSGRAALQCSVRPAGTPGLVWAKQTPLFRQRLPDPASEEHANKPLHPKVSDQRVLSRCEV